MSLFSTDFKNQHPEIYAMVREAAPNISGDDAVWIGMLFLYNKISQEDLHEAPLWLRYNHEEILNQSYKEYKAQYPETHAYIRSVTPKILPHDEQWLAKLYLNGKFSIDDIPDVLAWLRLYHDNNNNIGSSLKYYEDLTDLYLAVKRYDKNPRPCRLVANLVEKPDVLTLFQTEKARVTIPLSMAASCREGKNTTWCTASGTSPNIFWRYALEDPLLVLHVKKENNAPERKYGLHFATSQFRDEENIKTVLENLLMETPGLWNAVYPYALSAVQKNGRVLEFIQKERRSAELCAEAVKQTGWALYTVPKALVTPEMCVTAVRQSRWFLAYVPTEILSPELLLEAVKADGAALGYILSENAYIQGDRRLLDFVLAHPDSAALIQKLSEVAVQQKGVALKYVPMPLRTSELCRKAVQKDGLALAFVPNEQHTPELYMEAVANQGEALACVPEYERTPELCSVAVKQNGWALKEVPAALRTEEECLDAVRFNGRALNYVPEKHCTSAMCLEAVSHSKGILEIVPLKNREYKVCLAAVQTYGLSLTHVPEELRSEEMCLAAIRQEGDALRFLPPEQRTPDYCKKAVESNGLSLRFVPQEHQTPEIYLAAVSQNGGALQHVPKDKRSPGICLAAVKQMGFSIFYIDEKERTMDLFIEAVRSLSRNKEKAMRNIMDIVEHIPNKMQDQVFKSLGVTFNEKGYAKVEEYPADKRPRLSLVSLRPLDRSMHSVSQKTMPMECVKG